MRSYSSWFLVSGIIVILLVAAVFFANVEGQSAARSLANEPPAPIVVSR
jgi:hypothetical protein